MLVQRTYNVERIDECLRFWTLDQKVWGSIPAALAMCKSLGQALNPNRFWTPSSNGYQVDQTNWYCVNGASCRKRITYSPGR